MANEAVCLEAPRIIKRYTVADGGAIAKGTLLYTSSDPNTVSASSAADQSFAGIAIEEKVASDGVTQIGAAVDGVWDIKDSGSGMTIGTACALGGANLIVTADAADLLNGAHVGIVQETASAGEVVRVRLKGY